MVIFKYLYFIYLIKKIFIGNLMICGDLDKLYDELMSYIIIILMKIKNYPREYCVKLIEDWKFSNRIIIEKWL
jgi:hypothetical protein